MGREKRNFYVLDEFGKAKLIGSYSTPARAAAKVAKFETTVFEYDSKQQIKAYKYCVESKPLNGIGNEKNIEWLKSRQINTRKTVKRLSLDSFAIQQASTEVENFDRFPSLSSASMSA